MPGFQEMLVIAVVVLLVFGPDRLPELARTAGKALAKFRQETKRNVDELRRVADVQDLEKELRSLRNEMRETRSDVTRGVRDMAGLGDGDTPANDGPSRGTTPPDVRLPARADDHPPPLDPEAT